MKRRTPLYSAHLACGAKMIDFSGWKMPLHYGSQIDEHHAVRQAAGMFDVSHMLAIDLSGCEVEPYLRRLLANDVAKLKLPGKALYSCMLREDGGVIDDLIVYRWEATRYRLVVNAATAEKDLAWLRLHAAHFAVAITPRRDLAMIALQGPQARACFWRAFPEARPLSEPLAVFQAALWGDGTIARTGYTGEDGFEISLPAEQALDAWEKLLVAGVKPCGLGARDTLRLEAGMNLYGQDMDETVTPLESGLGWTVDCSDPDRAFIGRAALEAQRQGGALRTFLGLILCDRGVLRAHQPVICAHGVGETTSGTFSPTLGRAIALARLPAGTQAGEQVAVEMRQREVRAKVVKPPFVRHGKSLIEE